MARLLKFIPPRAKDVALYLIKVVILAVIYHLAARLGLQMAYVQSNTSPVWPPTGIALAALLIFGYNLWPGIGLGVLLGSIFTGAPLPLASGMAIGNTLEAVAAAYCLKRYIGFHNNLDRIQDVLGLVLFSVLSTTISATIGTLTIMLTSLGAWNGFIPVWVTWWIGDLLGALVVAPVLLVWSSWPGHDQKRTFAEGGLLLVLLALVTWYVFGGNPPENIFHQAMIYVIFPFAIWAALRLGQRGATSAILLVSGIAIWGTVKGGGPFSLESRNDSLVLLQTFMAVVSLTGLILAAATTERHNAAEAVRQRAEDLATLNDSSKTFLDNFESSRIYHTICQLAVSRLGLDIAWIEIGERDGKEGAIAAADGLPIDLIDSLKAQWDERSATPNAFLIKTVDAIPASQPKIDQTYQTYAAFPLTFGGQPIGMLKMVSKDKQFFTGDKQVLAQSYANLAAVVIQNTWLFEEVRTSNKQLHALSQRLMIAQEEERLHLSRELHDESGQLLAALSVQLGLLERDIAQPELALSQIDALKQTSNAIQDNLHKLAVHLRPASLDHLGLVMASKQLTEEFGRKYNIQVEFEAVGMQERRLPIEVETALFRIIQESLTNVVLHAQASRVDVLISHRDCHVITVIEDNGIGFHVPPVTVEDQLGLFGMRERIEMLGGEFSIESFPGKGTTVKAEVPCDD